ncbi:YicC/YloC family endoribonuclease [Syntrophorhabdus aromaticivorans]|uniref:YicC family protein n=1 Tax=Syntrophorhabdus aromaticivorans TaxID=328301 RepID=A0A971M2Z3_9BACT|nr:YicC/YloC family endoribonuclease [Syntrophorhabdus aromaticivorans]NLW34724.1 YicC family protein [Syntrophorhabdus aromaticivorans]
MPKSMTGFAKVEMEYADGKVYGEARALNNRYLEINIKLPRIDYTGEQKAREIVRRYVKRGKADITIKWDRTSTAYGTARINEDVVRQYIGLVETLKQDYGLTGGLTVENILGFKDVIAYEESNGFAEDVLLAAVESLLARLDEDRTREGELIRADLSKRLEEIARSLGEIEERQPLTAKIHEERLREKMVEVTKSSSIDEVRVLQELALYVERLDITEEIVRLKGHLDNFRSTLDTTGPMGRKLDFIIQEMVRETNTIGSKSNDLPINERVIKIKVEIEKIREQVQNVE